MRLSHSGTRRGFTLLELLVAMAIFAVVGTLAAQLLLSQQRLYRRLDTRTTVRRELRTTLSTLPTELRGLSTAGGDISDFSATALTFRSTIGASVACARVSSTVLDLPPVNTARTITSNWVTSPLAGDTIFVLRHDSATVRGDFWSAHRITAISTTTAACTGEPYTDPVRDAGKARVRLTLSPALPDSVQAGAAIRITRPARYLVAPRVSGRWYLHRQEHQNGAWATAVVLSGPYAPPSISQARGFAFTYFDSAGVAIAPGTNARRIARIDVALRTEPSTERGDAGFADSLHLRVAVRNRR